MAESSLEKPRYRGYLDGHRDWVTCIRTPPVESDQSAANTIVSTSRDKKVIVWKVDDLDSSLSNNETAGYALRSLSGHSQPISDLSLSSNAKYAISGSWDTTLRLWDLEAGKTLRTFKGHTSDVFSVALSPDNRQIVSGSRDRTIKLWNTMAECKYTIENDRHDDWVSCVRFSPSNRETLIVSCGWDKVVKVWDLKSCELRTNLVGHKGPLHTVNISPDGSLCASGGKDGVAMLWDVNEGNHLYSLAANSPINSFCFSPCRYWLCVATDDAIKIWNLEEGKNIIVNLDRSSVEGNKDSLVKEKEKSNRKKGADSGVPWCVSLAWSADGRILYAGSTDGRIYVYEFARDLNF